MYHNQGASASVCNLAMGTVVVAATPWPERSGDEFRYNEFRPDVASGQARTFRSRAKGPGQRELCRQRSNHVMSMLYYWEHFVLLT